jgi:phospholipase/lecithinase/hemolysin
VTIAMREPPTRFEGSSKPTGSFSSVVSPDGVDAVARALDASRAERRRADPAFTFAPDGVHPGDLGHLLMARTIASGLGLSLPEATLEAELARIQADPLFPLVRDRRALRSEGWLAHIGYTRGETYRAQSVQATERIATRLQTEIEQMASGR